MTARLTFTIPGPPVPNERARCVWGVDPSLACTAVVVLDLDGALVHVQRIGGKRSDFASAPERLHSMLVALTGLCEQHRPALAVLEGYAFSRNMAGQHAISEWGGVLRHAMWERGATYRECSPSALKKFVCGSGVAEKSLMLREVHKRWAFDARDDNEADAYALAQLARASVLSEIGETVSARERDAVAKLSGNWGEIPAQPKRRRASAARRAK
jgi:Holliday junction resolvasome RuvABC endonuclease subunit